MVKMCKWDPDLRCYRSSCDVINGLGEVSCCCLHENPQGRFLPRLHKSHLPNLVFNKHVLRRGF